MTPPPPLNTPDASLTPEQRRGRALLLTIFIVFVLLDVAIIVLKATQQGFASVITSCVRVCLSIALMYAIWVGQRWARWLFAVLMYAASALLLLAVISSPHPLLIAMLFVFVLAGSLVGFYKGISSFLNFQRDKK
jgi:hypothetical protein